jgi:flagellar hook-basal body complex protein FliE
MITPIAPLQINPLPIMPSPAPTPAAAGEGFGSQLAGMLQDVNTSQVKADEAVKNFATGQNTDVHEVMLAMEQARLSMMMTVEVRNKLVEAYQEMARMPV